MKLGKQVGLGLGHIVLDGDPALPPQRGTHPQFSTHICCGQMAAWIKMSLGMELGLGPGDFVLDEDPAPPSPKMGRSPQFSVHFYCGQTAECIKMPLGTDVGLSPGDFELDGDPVPCPKRGRRPPPPLKFLARVYSDQTAGWIKIPLGTKVGLSPGDSVRWAPSPFPKRRWSPGAKPPIFGPCLLWPNGWMDQDATWHGGRPWSSPHCARWGHSSPPKNGGRDPQFSAYLYCGQTAGCIKIPLGMEVVLSPGDFVLDGDLAPYPKRGGAPPNFRPTSTVAKRLHGSRCHLVRR